MTCISMMFGSRVFSVLKVIHKKKQIPGAGVAKKLGLGRGLPKGIGDPTMTTRNGYGNRVAPKSMISTNLYQTNISKLIQLNRERVFSPITWNR